MARKRPIFVPTEPARCCGKNRYGSKLEAERVSGEQMLLRSDLQLTVYACLCGCGDWHLARTQEYRDSIIAT